MLKCSQNIIKKLLILVLPMLIIVGVCTVSMPRTAFALPKPYEDIIDKNKEEEKKKEQEKQKQKEEEKKKKEAEKKKKEEEKRKRDREKEEENQRERERDKDRDKDKDRDHNDSWRGYNDWDHYNWARDYIPQIFFYDLKLTSWGNQYTEYFQPDSKINLEVSYMISDYDGYDDVRIKWRIINDRNTRVFSDQRYFPLRMDSYVTDIIYDAVPSPLGDNLTSFRIEVDVIVGNRQQTRFATGYIDKFSSCSLKDVYLSDEIAYESNHIGFDTSFLSESQPVYIVAKYEIASNESQNVEIAYTLKSNNNQVLLKGSITDRGVPGLNIAANKIWIPDYIPRDTTDAILEVLIFSEGKQSSLRSYYTFMRNGGVSTDDTRSRSDYRYMQRESITSVYVTRDSVRKSHCSALSRETPGYLIIEYFFPEIMSKQVPIRWIVTDPSGRLFTQDSYWVPQDEKRYIQIDLNLVAVPVGTYEYQVNMGDGASTQTVQGTFQVADGIALPESDAEQYITVPDVNISLRDLNVSFEVDGNFVFVIPSAWNGQFNNDNDLPSFTFEPSEGIYGMVEDYKFSDPNASMDSTIFFYEALEKNITSIDKPVMTTNMMIDSQNALLCSYEGKITTRGQYLGETTEDVYISILYVFRKTDDQSILYVVRLLSSDENSKRVDNIMAGIPAGIELQ
jgi:hypothetical protein